MMFECNHPEWLDSASLDFFEAVARFLPNNRRVIETRTMADLPPQYKTSWASAMESEPDD
jgi:hypothetical protein